MQCHHSCTHRRFYRLGGGWLGLLLGLVFSLQAVAMEGMHLDGQVSLPRVFVPLVPTQEEALRKRQVLRLGVTATGYEPLEVVRGQSVKGITADYLSIIGSSLGVKVEVRVFPDWTTALVALNAGEVDVLGRGSSYEQQLPGVLLSHPYTENQPVLVGRSENLGEDVLQSGGAMAVVDGYASLNTLQSRFPGVKMKVYDTVREALHAVEYQNVRWLVCDAATVAYHLALGELPNLRMRPLSGWQPAGYSFVFGSGDTALRDLFNQTLESIPRLAQADILGHWGVHARFDTARTSVYSPAQLDWLATRPEIRVAVNGGTPPYTFYDDDGHFRGLVADLMAEISQRSGLRFTFIEYSNADDVLTSMTEGHADMSTMLLPTAERKTIVNFTEPYVESSYALIGPRNSAITKLADLTGQRVAMVRNSSVLQYMQENFPDVELVLTDSYLETLMAVADEEVAAGVLLLPVSRYMINQYFAKSLRVITSLTQIQAPLSFAVAKDNSMLYEVMQASLDQIEPRLVGALVERWQNSLPAESSVWGGYERKLRWFIWAGVACLILLLAWQGYGYVRRSRERAEKARQSFRSALLDGIPQSVVVRDLQGRFVLCNHTFFSVFNLEPQTVIGRTWLEVDGLDATQEAAQEQAFQALLVRHEAIDIRQIELHIQGQPFTFRQWAVAHRGSDGQLLGLLMGWVDVSDTQRLLHQLQEVRDQAVMASEAKSRFLAVMSHEIRTPLNAIIGLLELTMERVDQGQDWDRAAIEVAYSSSGALMLLIGDILDLAKIESGKLTLEPDRNSPREILESVQRVFYGLARQKGLYLEADLTLESEGDVWVDGGRLKQVLSNLLGNAIKFTDRGGIKLSLNARVQGNDLHMVFIVQDSGIGISADDQARLFEPFTQVRGTGSHRGGTGLGLVICLQLVEMMGGRLTLKSEPGFGSQITVELSAPLLDALAIAEPTPGPVPDISDALSVLLVDDHEPNRLLLRQQLVFLGHRVKEAADGQQALTYLQDETFDVVITDCNMPIMDGYELTQRVRADQQAGFQQHCLIVGFTANAQAEERIRCLEVGMDDCLFKPVGLAMLRTCLAKVVRQDVLVLGQPEADPGVVEQCAIVDYFDLQLISSLTEGDVDLIRLLLGELHTTNEMDIRRLEEMLEAGRWREMGQIVHRLKGAGRMVGAQQLIEATKNYEAGLAQALPDDEARLRAMEVHASVQHLQAAVVAWMANNAESKTRGGTPAVFVPEQHR